MVALKRVQLAGRYRGNERDGVILPADVRKHMGKLETRACRTAAFLHRALRRRQSERHLAVPNQHMSNAGPIVSEMGALIKQSRCYLVDGGAIGPSAFLKSVVVAALVIRWGSNLLIGAAQRRRPFVLPSSRRIDPCPDFLDGGDMKFALNPSLDAEQIAADLAARKRVQIRDFLGPPSAEALLAHLQDFADWRHVLNAADNVYEIPCDELASMDEAQRVVLDRKTDERAAREFQFRFDTIRVPDSEPQRIATKTLLAEFAMFLSSPSVVGWFRSITGCNEVDFADAQATRYRNGAYLTGTTTPSKGKSVALLMSST